MERSSQSERSKYSILVNELNRRFEMLEDNKDSSEKIKIVDHYSQQLINSGYSKEKVRDIVRSGPKGIMRKESKRMKLSFKYRGAHEH